MADVLYPIRVIIGRQLTSEAMQLCERETEKPFKFPIPGITVYGKDDDGNFFITREFESAIPFEGLRYVTRTYDPKGRLISIESPSKTIEYSPPGSWKRRAA